MKAILLYLLLVGVPILAIVGVLQIGRNLSAPISLSGKWSAQLSAPTLAEPLASNRFFNPLPTSMTISQSGRYLLLSFNDGRKTTLVGQLIDQSLSATVARSGTAITFRAAVNRRTEADRMIGVLIVEQENVRLELPVIATKHSAVDQASMGR